MEEDQNLTKKELRDLKKQQKIAEREKQEKVKQARSFATWASVFVLIVGSVWGLVQFGGGSSDDSGAALLIKSISASDWFAGNRDSKVVIVEYGDYQCPACAAYHPFTKKLTEEFSSNIAFVYRHFPLRNIHRYANLAAQAAEAAGKQGKFWEMDDLLYANQESWKDSNDAEKIFISYAESLRLDPNQFQTDLKSEVIKAKIEADFQSGLKANVRGTPTFFINGKSIKNPLSYDEFKRIIIEAGAAPVEESP